MRTRAEVCALMGAKDREVDDIAETDDGTVVTIHGFRSLIHPDGSMTHGVAEPEVEIVGEVSDEDAERIAQLVNEPADESVEHPADGTWSPEISGDGSGEALPPIGKEYEVLADATVAEVLEWVGGDAELAARALAVEESRDGPRSTLLTALRKLAG